MTIKSKVIRTGPSPMYPVPLMDFDISAKRDVLGDFFAAHDRLKQEQRIEQQIANRPFTATRRAGTPAKEKSRMIVRITDKKVERVIQPRSTPTKQPPTPIKPIERTPNPFLDQYKNNMEALFDRINRVIGPNPNQQPDINE